MNSRKGLALAIMSKIPSKDKGKGDDYEKEPKGDDDEGMGAEAAARSIRKAIESGDDAKLAEALRDFIDIC